MRKRRASSEISEGKRMSEELIEAEIEILEKEILSLKGEARERAIEAYRKLISSVDKPVYLVRSE